MSSTQSFKQELVGVFGFPVAENPTQAMMEPAFADMGLDWRYLTVEVRPHDLGDAVRGARDTNGRGSNSTIPNKVAVIAHLDRSDPEAEMTGFVPKSPRARRRDRSRTVMEIKYLDLGGDNQN